MLASDPIVLGRYRADASGTTHATVTIPKRVRAGWHTFKVTARNPDLTCSARIKVWAAGGRPDHGHGDDRDDGQNEHNRPERPDHGPDLADTGSENLAAGVIAAGGGTMLAVRRRRSA
ncbi:hypothetical protein [Streptomyces sp. 147326]|uniref:hypothetical protein n=1 Tax=Streptomyces sp. 147326 TaxID=3074379 RepID=UPI003857864D